MRINASEVSGIFLIKNSMMKLELLSITGLIVSKILKVFQKPPTPNTKDEMQKLYRKKFNVSNVVFRIFKTICRQPLDATKII